MYKTLHKKQGSVTVQLRFARSSVTFCAKRDTYKLKGGNFTRVLALIIAVVIAFFCTLGQSAGSWKSFGIYLGVGVLLWLWMVLVNWKKHPVEIETVEGLKKF